MERHVADVANGFVKKHDVSVLAHSIHKPLFDESVAFHHADLDHWRYNPFLVRSVVSKMRQIKPDVIHVHSRKAAVVIAQARKHWKTPTVLTLHNLGDASKFVDQFDCVIGVSSLVARSIDHPCKRTVFNGIG